MSAHAGKADIAVASADFRKWTRNGHSTACAASVHGVRIHTSRSPSVVKISRMPWHETGATTAFGSVVKNAYATQPGLPGFDQRAAHDEIQRSCGVKMSVI